MKKLKGRFSQSEEELKKSMDNMKDWIRIKIEHLMIIHPNSSFYFECKKCRYRQIHEQEKFCGIEAVVSWVTEKAVQSEAFRLTLLANMAEEMDKSVDYEENI